MPRPTSRSAKVVLVVALAVLAPLASLVTAVSGTASAATVDAVATIASPGTTTELKSGGSTTPFTVALPAQAKCSGDSAHDGYEIYSYLVKPGTDLSKLSYAGGEPPAGVYGLFEAPHTFWGPVNTAATTGEIIGIPNDFEWQPLLDVGVTVDDLLYGTGHTSGVWEAGVLCANKSNVPTDNWNTEVTFTASSSDSNGFVWSAVPGKSGISGKPTVTKVTPNSGPAGTSVTITGTNLSGATSVKFGTADASITADSATSITAVAPTGETGKVNVTVTTGGGTSATSSADAFTYSAVVVTPTVTAVSPTAGRRPGAPA
jgi:hypothetical protein